MRPSSDAGTDGASVLPVHAESGADAGFDAGTLLASEIPQASILGPANGDTLAPHCAGLLPASLPVAIWNSTPLSLAGEGQRACGLPIGNGHGTIALAQKATTRWSWKMIAPSGAAIGRLEFWNGSVIPQASGFIAYAGSSTLAMEVTGIFDDTGRLLRWGADGMGNELLAAADPNGGLLVAGQLVLGRPEPTTATPQSAMMFDKDANIRWGPVALNSQAHVWALAVDLSARSLVLLDGTERFGPGSVSGIWFDSTGAVLTPEFLVARLTVQTWLQLYPLISGGLVLASVRQDWLTEAVQSEWIAVLPSGESRVVQVPPWLVMRPNMQLAVAQGGRAYAMLPWGASLEVCDQQVEIVSSAGDSCGRIDLPLDGYRCVSRDIRLGLDGTVMQMLPRSREPFDPPGSGVRDCTVRFWPAALK